LLSETPHDQPRDRKGFLILSRQKRLPHTFKTGSRPILGQSLEILTEEIEAEWEKYCQMKDVALIMLSYAFGSPFIS
jgi:hypothetical protein